MRDVYKRLRAHLDSLPAGFPATEEGIEQFMSSDTPKRVCFPAVSVAYRLVVDLLTETSQPDGP